MRRAPLDQPKICNNASDDIGVKLCMLIGWYGIGRQESCGRIQLRRVPSLLTRPRSSPRLIRGWGESENGDFIMSIIQLRRLSYVVLAGGFLMQSCALDLDTVGGAAETSLEGFFAALITALVNGLIEF